MGQNCVWLFYYVSLERNYDILKSKSPRTLLNNNINLTINKNRKRKGKIWHTVLERRNLFFSSYNNRKLKETRSWVGAFERKKGTCFAPFILSEGSFFNICFLSQSMVYWIDFQNIHTFTYQKKMLQKFFRLFFTLFKIGWGGWYKKVPPY